MTHQILISPETETQLSRLSSEEILNRVSRHLHPVGVDLPDDMEPLDHLIFAKGISQLDNTMQWARGEHAIYIMNQLGLNYIPRELSIALGQMYRVSRKTIINNVLTTMRIPRSVRMAYIDTVSFSHFAEIAFWKGGRFTEEELEEVCSWVQSNQASVEMLRNWIRTGEELPEYDDRLSVKEIEQILGIKIVNKGNKASIKFDEGTLEVFSEAEIEINFRENRRAQ